MMIKTFYKKAFLGLFLSAMLLSCKKHEINQYEINNVNVTSNSGSKNNLKNDLQLISIMYSDLYGNSIPSTTLQNLYNGYISFGDKNIIVEKITQNFLLDPLAVVPSDSIMRLDPDTYITNAYKKFLIRTPSEAELWYIKNTIEQSNNLTSRDVYYAILTSEEYKHY